MAMSDEERRRVYLEEKARQEARHAYEEAQRELRAAQLRKLGFALLGMLVGVGLVWGGWYLMGGSVK